MSCTTTVVVPTWAVLLLCALSVAATLQNWWHIIRLKRLERAQGTDQK